MGDAKDYKPYTVKWISDEGKIENWLVDGTGWNSMVGMAEDKANGRSIEVWTRPREKDVDEEMLFSKLSLMRQEEMDKMMEDMTGEAKQMVQDYVDNPSQLSGEVDVDKGLVKGDGIVVHQNSPQLDESEDSWKSFEELKSEYEIDEKGAIKLDDRGNPMKTMDELNEEKD